MCATLTARSFFYTESLMYMSCLFDEPYSPAWSFLWFWKLVDGQRSIGPKLVASESISFPG